MSLLQRVEAWLETRVWKFLRVVHSANHDYPYHDFLTIDNSAGQDVLIGTYAVGENNLNAHGDQSKRFVAKRTIFTSLVGVTVIHLNDSRNVAIIPIQNMDAINTIYELELHTNIANVTYEVPIGATLYMYFEGVLPEETRDAE